MKLVFFDLVTHYGGAPQSMVLTYSWLMQHDEVQVLDAYGVCEPYLAALEKAGVPYHVLAPDTRRTYVGHRGRPLARTLSLLMQSGSLLRLQRNLARKVREIDPDVICTVSPKGLLLLSSCLGLRRFRIAYYAHGWSRRDQHSALKRWLIRTRPYRVLAVSEATSSALQSWGVPADRIRVVFNALGFEDTISAGQRSPSSPPPRANKGWKILLPASLLRTKGQDTAIAATHLLKQRGHEVVLWLAGDLAAGCDRGYVEGLEAEIARCGLEQCAFLLGWRDDLPALLTAADVLVLPTHSEGLPRVVEEAMLLQRPVVATPVGGVTDLVIDGETGLLFPVGDGPALARAVERLLLDQGLREKLTENAHRRMHSVFSSERQSRLVRAALQPPLADHGRDR